MKTIVVTGISSGIGEALATKLLKDGHRVVGISRNSRIVTEKFASYSQTQFLFYSAELTQYQSLNAFRTFLADNNIDSLDGLVNNAGVAFAAPFEVQDFSQVQETVAVNLLSVMYLTQLMIPLLSKKQGRIVNISSVSGQNGTPFLAAYCASKYAIEGFSESLRRELTIQGIGVSIIGPGSVKTPIWNKGLNKISEVISLSIYINAFEKFVAFAQDEEAHGLRVDYVVADILHALFSAKPKIRYFPIPRKWRNYYLPQLFSKTFLDKIMIKNLGLTKKP